MSWKLRSIAVAAVVLGSLIVMVAANALDIDELERRGEVYIAALYTGYQSEAEYFDKTGHGAVADFLRARADAVELGAELFPVRPMSFPSLTRNEDEKDALVAAYNETYALVGSEAADVAPEMISAVQISYETWLFMSGTENAHSTLDGARRWQAALERFVDWSEGADKFALGADNHTPVAYVPEALLLAIRTKD